MRRLGLVVFCLLVFSVALFAKEYQIGAFTKRSIQDIEKAYSDILRDGYTLSIFEKDGVKKVVVDIPESQVKQF